MLLCPFTRHGEAFWLLCFVNQERCVVLATEFYSDEELFCATYPKRRKLYLPEIRQPLYLPE